METTDLLFGIIIVCLITQGAQPFLKTSIASQRRIYWICTGIECLALCLIVQPDWKKGIIGGVLFFIGMTIAAFSYTPYIIISGKVRALGLAASNVEHEEESTSPDHDPAPNSYSGIITAAKYWWILLGAILIFVGNIYAYFARNGEGWVALSGAIILCGIAAMTGLGDASWDYPIARGQYLQLGIATLLTAGSFTLLYLLCYAIGIRRPLRRRQSLEYRAHPRLRHLE